MLKISKDAKSVLRFLQDSKPTLKGRFYTIESMDTSKLNMNNERFIAALECLLQVGAIKSNQDVFVVSLTDLGLHSKQYTALEIRDFIVKSIATPIVVSFITAIITVIITNLIS